jgi:hypothetical protein
LVRSTYSDNSKWLVHFVAGSGQSYLLDEQSSKNTITEIGQVLLADDPLTFKRLDADLPQQLGSLLADTLESLSVKQSMERASLAAVADSLRHSAPNSLVVVRPSITRRAWDLLANLPAADPLFAEMQAYTKFDFGAGLEFPPFDVATRPAFDVPSWNARAQTLTTEPSGRCRATVAPLGSTTPTFEADAISYPRVLEVQLVRPWLVNSFLDNRLARSGTQSVFFGEGGTLVAIPDRLWILLSDEVQLRFADARALDQTTAWATAGGCCHISCGGTDYSLDSNSVRRRDDGTIRASRSGLSPLVFAIVSARRHVK